MIVLDTHAWVHWLADPTQLSAKARKAIDRAKREQRLYVSCISAWEVALLVERGRLELTMDVQDWVAHSEALPFFQFVPVDSRIAVRSVRLPGTFHPDPADRIIVATALILGSSLVTGDRKIRAYSHVKSVW